MRVVMAWRHRCRCRLGGMCAGLDGSSPLSDSTTPATASSPASAYCRCCDSHSGPTVVSASVVATQISAALKPAASSEFSRFWTVARRAPRTDLPRSFDDNYVCLVISYEAHFGFGAVGTGVASDRYDRRQGYRQARQGTPNRRKNNTD
jgi:hypothetical protein